jgi:hypothetical protein
VRVETGEGLCVRAGWGLCNVVLWERKGGTCKRGGLLTSLV